MMLTESRVPGKRKVNQTITMVKKVIAFPQLLDPIHIHSNELWVVNLGAHYKNPLACSRYAPALLAAFGFNVQYIGLILGERELTSRSQPGDLNLVCLIATIPHSSEYDPFILQLPTSPFNQYPTSIFVFSTYFLIYPINKVFYVSIGKRISTHKISYYFTVPDPGHGPPLFECLKPPL